MPVSRVVILPYKGGSKSARLLAQGLSESLGLKVRRVRPDGKYRPKRRSLVINYGSNQAPGWWQQLTPVNSLNAPASCANTSKLRAFQLFKQNGVSTPEWTTDRNAAQQWIQEGKTVVCRTMLNSHSGRGIVLSNQEKPLVPAPLYVLYKKKKKEFRVHIFNGRVVDVSEKRRVRKDNRPEAFDGFIRNHANGWVFCRDNINKPTDLDDVAIRACRACNLDFGAVDVIWNEKENRSYVLEVNTAPGLEGTTLQSYKNAILNWIRSK